MRNKKQHVSNDTVLYIEFIKARLESAMPEVHRQVKVYEEKLKSGKLTAPPKHFPLFSE